MTRSTQIDRLLRAATETGQVPGVVALAATQDGIVYEGAFGRRGSPDGAAMTMDSIFWIASMTKAVTAVAAMRLVEQGRLDLDAPAGAVLPQLAAPQVLEGFDADGTPRLRPARRPITLRQLLTHTAGYGYENWNPDLQRYARQTGLPNASSGQLAALGAPLMRDPGERWEYGISIDVAGRMIDTVSGESLDAHFRRHVFAPLGMRDSGYVLQPEQTARRVQLHARRADGTLAPTERAMPAQYEFYPGGGALFSTGPDYIALLRMLLGEGTHGGATLLRPETVRLMAQNHIGDIAVGGLKTANPEASNDVELLPGIVKKWGLSFLINTARAPSGRSAGSLAWGGLANTYFWVDPTRRVAGLLLTQILPFGDPTVLRLFEAFETAVYDGLP